MKVALFSGAAGRRPYIYKDETFNGVSIFFILLSSGRDGTGGVCSNVLSII